MIDFEHFREILRQFGPSSAIDVFIVAALIFAVLRLVSRTRAMTQLRGLIALVLAAVLLGRMFELTVVNFIVRNSVTAVLVGLLIIFQPEIRRGLDRVGRTGLQGLFGRQKYDEVIDSVVRAAARMSEERHGGLIVVERETGLQDVIDTGVSVDARISPELLEGIFYPNSPLHDMAVVLREDRVVAAGCVLPLASDLSVGDRSLGTRHRAAIGITEHTDALSVVVSEETGGISIALGGRLTPVADERRLRAALEWVLEPDASKTASGSGGAPV